MKAGRKTSSARSGAKDFISFIHEWGHPEWIVIACKAPLEEVSQAYAGLCGATGAFGSVAMKPARKMDTEIASLVTIAKPRHSAWTVILRSLCVPIQESEIKEAEKDARALSKKLKARTATFCGADTSYSMTWRLFAGGKQVEQKEWEQTVSPGSAFRPAKLYLPACFPCRAEDDPWLAVQASSEGTIETATLLDLETAKSKTKARISPAEAKKLAAKLHRAALAGNLGQIKKLIAAGADLDDSGDTASWDGFTPLIAAASKGRVAAVNLLLAEGAEVDLPVSSDDSDWTGATALAMAARNGHLDVVNALLKAGARVKFNPDEFATAIQYAAETDRLSIVQALLKAGAVVTQHAVSRAIKRALRTGNLKLLQELLKSGQRLPFTPSTVSHAIPAEAWPTHKQMPLAEALIKGGADINGDHCAALRNCITQRNAELLRFLIKSGAALNGSRTGPHTPLHYAALRNWVDGARILVEAGAKLDATNCSGQTPEEWSKSQGSKEAAKFLSDLSPTASGRH
jgi:ankyrin repeat protein